MVSSKATKPHARLGQLRLLVALDALLVEGSVGGAAIQMGLSIAAMSRLLGQIRDIYNDPILVRSGRRMVATPRAEALRSRLRSLAVEAEALLAPNAWQPPLVESNNASSWAKPGALPVVPLGIRPVIQLENQPTPEQLAADLSRIDAENDPRRRLAKYIAVIGRKIGHTRPLSEAEAEDAFYTIFRAEADPMQISALLRLMHYRGETAPELAGMMRAAKRALQLPALNIRKSLDWPAYMPPKYRQAPWFIQSAKLVAQAGYPVVLHGSCGSGPFAGKLEFACELLDIPVCKTIAEASAAVATTNIVYMPLAAFAPQIFQLLALYPLFESRSPINSVTQMLNPLNCDVSLVGVTQPTYRELHRDAAKLLGWMNIAVLSSSRDVAELMPYRPHIIHQLIGGKAIDMKIASISRSVKPERIDLSTSEYWQAVWHGRANDEQAEETILATATLALMAVTGSYEVEWPKWRLKAQQLWQNRLGS
ncbi:glycosyl transferase family protein [Paraburkholderia aspalathi]|nr:glycosyl transferase family protein [Paraburkholderia aspalathi]